GVNVSGIELPARFQLDQGQRIRRVAVDLVGRGEDEGRLGAKQAGRFQYYQRALRVDRKVRQRFTRRPIMARLRGGMNDQRDLFAVLLKQAEDARLITNIQ